MLLHTAHDTQGTILAGLSAERSPKRYKFICMLSAVHTHIKEDDYQVVQKVVQDRPTQATGDSYEASPQVPSILFKTPNHAPNRTRNRMFETTTYQFIYHPHACVCCHQPHPSLWIMQAVPSYTDTWAELIRSLSRPDTHPQAPEGVHRRRSHKHTLHTLDGSLPEKVRDQGAQPSWAPFCPPPLHRRSKRHGG